MTAVRVPLSWEGNDMEVKRFPLPITGSHLLMSFLLSSPLEIPFPSGRRLRRSLSAKALRSRFLTPPSSDRKPSGDPLYGCPVKSRGRAGSRTASVLPHTALG
jgi:hypothetical protein